MILLKKLIGKGMVLAHTHSPPPMATPKRGPTTPPDAGHRIGRCAAARREDLLMTSVPLVLTHPVPGQLSCLYTTSWESRYMGALECVALECVAVPLAGPNGNAVVAWLPV
jgi:hypothetical protein